MTHSLADCPLRTFCCITTTHEPPFRILHLDHSALDLFLTPSASHDDDPKLDRADQGAFSQGRARLVDTLLGKTIADILSPECTSYPQSISQQHPGEGATVQSFVLSEQVLGDFSSNGSVRQGDQHTRRRLHGCIHKSVPYAPRPGSIAPVATRAWSPDRPHATQQQQNQVVPQLSVSDQGASASTAREADEATVSLCRVYVLKDATDMVELAQEILQQQQTQRREQQQIQQQIQQRQQYHSMHLVPPFPSLPPSSSTSSSARSDRPAASLHSVTRLELYSSNDDAHWSGESLQGADAHLGEEQCAAKDDRALVLLLQVTRFGTVDHAFTLDHQGPDDSRQQRRISILDLTNTSVTAFVHPDDIHTLCRGLDRICKSLHTLLRIRWRIQARTLFDLRYLNNHVQEETTVPAVNEQEVHSRWIEFQGQHFEEWVDPTAFSDKPSDLLMDQGYKDRHKDNDYDKVKDDDDEEEEAEQTEEEENEEEIYAWVEVTGTLSNGQPLLAIRPLAAQERHELQEKTCKTPCSIVPSQQSSRTGYKQDHATCGVFNSTDGEYDPFLQESTEWKGKSKRMDLEEGMRMPRQLDVSSALTALTRISSQDSTRGLRMPGSFPFHMTQTPQQKLLQQQLQHLQEQRHQQIQQLQHMSSDTNYLFYGGHSRSSSGLVSPMSTVLACPTATSTAPWSLFMSAALEAWRQWIQVVHAGQAQFQDWCEYVLETTIDRLIDVSLGLALLGVDSPSADRFLEEQQSPSSSSTSSSSSFNKTKRIRSQSQSPEHIHKRQKKMSGIYRAGLYRAGQLLQGYPSLEGALRSFGNSWLGLKIRNRLEQKMEIDADHVVDWWEGENAEAEKELEESCVPHSTALSSQISDGSSTRSPSSMSCSTMTEMEESGLKELKGSLEIAVAAPEQA
ncbi:hypothetical protein BGZ75_008578, partial [Mortierella antarctica]